MSVEELDLFKGLRAGIVTAQVRVHPKEEIEGSGTFQGGREEMGQGDKELKKLLFGQPSVRILHS